MTPYEVLGVTTSASTEEIEARYRLLLREYHPDLHQGEGADSLAHCELMTRNINAAMARVRDMTMGPPRPSSRGRSGGEGRDGRTGATTGQWFGDNPFYRPPSSETDDVQHGTYSREARDWFGEPVDHSPDEPVPCPLCGSPFLRLADYELHLQQAHNFRQVIAAAPKARSRTAALRIIGHLRFIPSWFVALFAFVMWRVFGFYAFVAASCFLCLVMFTQTSQFFKRRR